MEGEEGRIAKKGRENGRKCREWKKGKGKEGKGKKGRGKGNGK